MKGLILAGGLGTRARPMSYTGAKQMIPVANKPVICYGIEDMRRAGITEIGIIVGYTKERIASIVDVLGDGSQYGVHLTYIEQDAPRGLAHAVSIAQDFLGEDDFIVYLGDNIIKQGVKEAVDDFQASQADITLCLASVKDPRRYGVALFDDNGWVVDVEEKPEHPKTNHAIVGVYLFRKNIFEILPHVKPGRNNEIQLTDAIKVFVQDPSKKVKATLIEGWWDDTGNAESLLHANHMVLMDLQSKNEGSVDDSCDLLGNISIGKGTVITKGVRIKGPVIIGKNCTITHGAYLGPYTAVGDGCVLDGAEIESSIILDGATITVQERIVDSLIGKKAKVIKGDTKPKGHKFVLGEGSEVKL